MINENAEIYKKSENLKKPIYISCAIAACLEACSVIWSEVQMISFIWKLAAAVIIAMPASVIFLCNKESATKEAKTNIEENTEDKS